MLSVTDLLSISKKPKKQDISLQFLSTLPTSSGKVFVKIPKLYKKSIKEIEEERTKEELLRNDLLNIMQKKEVNYRGEALSENDRQRILGMLELLFPEK